MAGQHLPDRHRKPLQESSCGQAFATRLLQLGENQRAFAAGDKVRRQQCSWRARARFGDRYDYSAIVYRSFKSPIKIRCREHPVRLISITPERHLVTTGGCKYCLRQLRGQLPEG